MGEIIFLSNEWERRSFQQSAIDFRKVRLFDVTYPARKWVVAWPLVIGVENVEQW